MEEKRAQKKADASSSSDVEGGYHGGGSQRRKSEIVANKASSSRVSFSYMNDEQVEELENKSLPERKKTFKVKIAVKTASGSTRILLSSKSPIFVDLVEYGEENDTEECASKSATVTDDGNHGVAVVAPSSQGDENGSSSRIEETEHFKNLLNQPDEDVQGEVNKEDGEEEGPILSNFSAGTQEPHIPGNQASSIDGQNEEEIDTSATPGIILKRKSSTPMIDSSITKTGKPAQISNPSETASVPSFRKRKWGSIKYYRCQKCPQKIYYVGNLQGHAKLHDGNDPSIIACEICNLPMPSEKLEKHRSILHTDNPEKSESDSDN
ncbi:unnamed protein product [Orchesella dallaii]|uniref:C2H2-type domain-containing protein n=1 Tax=Orchesella dallaii TaxID=48710 RepID=A0ABP1PZS6_9HEXA